jgi:dTDP-4-dehydrorhamnose reductase
LNLVFAWFLGSDAAGVYHLGGPRPNTLYQIGQIVNRVGGYHPRLLRGHPRLDAGPIPPRAGNVTMNSARLVKTLGFQPFRPWPSEPELFPVDRLWHFDRGQHECGSFADIKTRLYQPARLRQSISASA